MTRKHTNKKLKYGNVDLLPEDFDPKNGFIAVEFYDKIKAERDQLRTRLEDAEAEIERLRAKSDAQAEKLCQFANNDIDRCDTIRELRKRLDEAQSIYEAKHGKGGA